MKSLIPHSQYIISPCMSFVMQRRVTIENYFSIQVPSQAANHSSKGGPACHDDNFLHYAQTFIWTINPMAKHIKKTYTTDGVIHVKHLTRTLPDIVA